MAPDGRPYDANDPHLLTWVHIAEVDSFLAAYQRFGAGAARRRPSADGYVADMARVAGRSGRARPAPISRRAALPPRLVRPGAGRAPPAARDAARFLLLQPPVPLAARGPYTLLGATAVALLPWRAKVMLRIPPLPITEAVIIRPAGRALVAGMRWALTTGAPDTDTNTESEMILDSAAPPLATRGPGSLVG